MVHSECTALSLIALVHGGRDLLLETVDRIRRRAEAIRREWKQEESSMAIQAAM
jgi:hypothetical protein